MAEALRRVLAYERHALPVVALPCGDGGALGPSAAEVVDAVVGHRVVGVLAGYLGALGVREELLPLLRPALEQHVADGVWLEFDTAMVSGLLTTAGIEHMVVKGVALAAVSGLAATARGAGDVDVWVRPGDVARAEEVIGASGWHRVRTGLPHSSESWRWRLLLAVANELPMAASDGNAVDLHWRLTPFAGEAIPGFDEALERSVRLNDVAVGMRTLCPADALRHLAQHGRKDRWPTLRHVVDVVRLVDRCDPDEVAAMVRTEPNVALALAVAAHIAGGTVDDPVLVGGDVLSERSRRLADEAWRSCLSLDSTLSERRRHSGWRALVARCRYEGWQARSAPSLRAVLSWAARLIVPLGLVARSRPDR